MTAGTGTPAGRSQIVVGVDGSDHARRALAWAADQAKLTGATLVVVATWMIPSSYGYPVAWPEGMDFAGDARRALDEAVEKTISADSALEIERVVFEGHPAVVLEEQSRGAALVVVGSRGHGEFAGMLLGSVSEYLATHAHCPVVIIRGESAVSAP